ncbi:MAG TPA: acyl-CoA dehydrogenase family protein [Streptosporangiaceae bacterium]|nr:acyl-CoA dehydrogenase family protein [Streptosporangiaceae bacterium]
MTTDVPARAEVVERVSKMVPTLAEHAVWAEEHRRLADEQVQALAEAGVFKLRAPARYGGYEAGTRTLVDVAAQLARADGSLAWTVQVYWIPTWMACLFPDDVQDEVFATPDVRVCGTLSPSAIAVPSGDGLLVNGRWGFITGAHHAHWQEVIAVVLDGDRPPMPVVALVPMSDLEVVDDWHTTGLRGTGSVSTVAKDVFVPSRRVLPLPAVLRGASASAYTAGRPIYRAPLLPVASASSVGIAAGLAAAAREVFFGRLPDRKITYTSYEHQAEAPLTHLRVAEAAQRLDEAEFHAHRLAALVDGKCASGSEWSIADRALARGELGAACRAAREAVDIYASASGGSSVYADVPMGRIRADINAVTLHALMNPDVNAELYGRVTCGLEPNTLYI